MFLHSDKYGYRVADSDTHLTQKARDELRRTEWISLKYHSFYHPSCGYDFELDWIVATGGLVSDMVCIRGLRGTEISVRVPAGG